MIEVNLLPQEYRKRTRKKKDVNIPLIMGGVLLMLFLVYIGLEYGAKSKRAEIQRLTNQFDNLGKKYLVAKAVVDEVRPLKLQLKMLEELGQKRVVWAKILNDLSDVFPDELKLTSIKEQEGELEIKGIVFPGLGDENVTRLIQSLKEEEVTSFPFYFSQITLESIAKQKKSEVKEFKIRCKFSKEFIDGA